MALNLEGVISMMWYWGGGVQWWGWLIMSLTMVVFWGLVIWGIYAIVTSYRRSGGGEGAAGAGQGPRGDGALRILDERLARGEIDADEYRRLRELIISGGRREHADTGPGR